MSNALIKIGPGLNGGPLGLGSDAQKVAKLSPDMLSIRLPAGEVILVSGPSEGTHIADGEVQANQRVVIYPFPKSKARTYQVVVSYNPKLLHFGSVSVPSVLHPQMSGDICMHFHAAKKTNLNDFLYIFELLQLS